jgi:hypothetical protein
MGRSADSWFGKVGVVRADADQARQASIACAAKMPKLEIPKTAIITSNMEVVQAAQPRPTQSRGDPAQSKAIRSLAHLPDEVMQSSTINHCLSRFRPRHSLG